MKHILKWQTTLLNVSETDIRTEYDNFYECCRSKLWSQLKSQVQCKISVMDFFVPKNLTSIGDCVNETPAIASRYFPELIIFGCSEQNYIFLTKQLIVRSISFVATELWCRDFKIWAFKGKSENSYLLIKSILKTILKFWPPAPAIFWRYFSIGQWVKKS